jgi:hypothetical protein
LLLRTTSPYQYVNRRLQPQLVHALNTATACCSPWVMNAVPGSASDVAVFPKIFFTAVSATNRLLSSRALKAANVQGLCCAQAVVAYHVLAPPERRAVRVRLVSRQTEQGG